MNTHSWKCTNIDVCARVCIGKHLKLHTLYKFVDVCVHRLRASILVEFVATQGDYYVEYWVRQQYDMKLNNFWVQPIRNSLHLLSVFDYFWKSSGISPLFHSVEVHAEWKLSISLPLSVYSLFSTFTYIVCRNVYFLPSISISLANKQLHIVWFFSFCIRSTNNFLCTTSLRDPFPSFIALHHELPLSLALSSSSRTSLCCQTIWILVIFRRLSCGMSESVSVTLWVLFDLWM